MRRLPGAAAAILPALFTPAVAAAPALVFLDTDFLGPGGSSIQSVLPLLRRPDMRVRASTS